MCLTSIYLFVFTFIVQLVGFRTDVRICFVSLPVDLLNWRLFACTAARPRSVPCPTRLCHQLTSIPLLNRPLYSALLLAMKRATDQRLKSGGCKVMKRAR